LCEPNLARHVEDDALFKGRYDLDRHVVALADGFDNLFDDNLGRRSSRRDADRLRTFETCPRNIRCALDKE
jgi:elongation factor P--beta-lysine ligase